MNFWAVILAILPVVIMLLYVLVADMRSPEPVKLLFKAVGFGFATIPISLACSSLFNFLGLNPDEIISVGDAINTAFWGAAIPEEMAKFTMFWLLVRNNRYFDEKMDGILYAVIVSLGFAVIENIIYLHASVDDFVEVGVLRAVFSIPGHFGDGVLMGYFYSLAVFGNREHKRRNLALSIIMPIFAHGLYDSLLFIQEVSDISAAWASYCMCVFVIFCIGLWRYSRRNIRVFFNEAKEEAVIRNQLYESEYFYIRIDGETFGPYTLSEMKKYPLTEDTMITTDHLNGEWYEANCFECFDTMFASDQNCH